MIYYPLAREQLIALTKISCMPNSLVGRDFHLVSGWVFFDLLCLLCCWLGLVCVLRFFNGLCFDCSLFCMAGIRVTLIFVSGLFICICFIVLCVFWAFSIFLVLGGFIEFVMWVRVVSDSVGCFFFLIFCFVLFFRAVEKFVGSYFSGSC